MNDRAARATDHPADRAGKQAAGRQRVGWQVGPRPTEHDELAVRVHALLQQLRTTVDLPVVAVDDLAHRFGCSPALLEQVLHELCEAGHLEALRQTDGRYYVNRA